MSASFGDSHDLKSPGRIHELQEVNHLHGLPSLDKNICLMRVGNQVLYLLSPGGGGTLKIFDGGLL